MGKEQQLYQHEWVGWILGHWCDLDGASVFVCAQSLLWSGLVSVPLHQVGQGHRMTLYTFGIL